MTLNFLDLTGLIAEVDNLPSEHAPTLLRRVRTFDTKNLIPVYREETGRREGRVDLVGACMARIHSELIDFGMDAATLRRLREFLDEKAELGGKESRFEAAIARVRESAEVSLIIELWQRPSPWAKAHSFRLEGAYEKNERAANAAAMNDAAQGIVVRARLALNLSQLLSQFIELFELTIKAEG